MKSEWNNKCDECKDEGTNTFARIFYRKIKGKWLYLCKECWNKK